MYQMYAYLKRFEKVKQVHLLYPKITKNDNGNGGNNDNRMDYGWYNSDEKVGVRFFDLEELKNNESMLHQLLPK